MYALIHRFLMQPLNISQLLKDLMNLCFILNKKILLVFLSFIYNGNNMPTLIENRTVSGMGNLLY